MKLAIQMFCTFLVGGLFVLLYELTKWDCQRNKYEKDKQREMDNKDVAKWISR